MKKSKSFRNTAIIIILFVFATLALMMNNISSQTSGNFIFENNPIQSSFNLGILIIILIIIIGIFVYYLEKITEKIVKMF